MNEDLIERAAEAMYNASRLQSSPSTAWGNIGTMRQGVWRDQARAASKMLLEPNTFVFVRSGPTYSSPMAAIESDRPEVGDEYTLRCYVEVPTLRYRVTEIFPLELEEITD